MMKIYPRTAGHWVVLRYAQSMPTGFRCKNSFHNLDTYSSLCICQNIISFSLCLLIQLFLHCTHKICMCGCRMRQIRLITDNIFRVYIGVTQAIQLPNIDMMKIKSEETMLFAHTSAIVPYWEKIVCTSVSEVVTGRFPTNSFPSVGCCILCVDENSRKK